MSAADIFSIVDISSRDAQTVGIRMERCIVYSYKRHGWYYYREAKRTSGHDARINIQYMLSMVRSVRGNVSRRMRNA